MLRPQIVLFGDSITQASFNVGGWGGALANTYGRRADVLIRGYAGFNTTWGLIMLQQLFPLDDPSPTPLAGITICFGANDAALVGRFSETKHVPIDEYKENLCKMTQHVKQYSPSVQIVMITPPPIDEAKRLEVLRAGGRKIDVSDRTLEETGKYAKKVVELSKELGLPYIDLWSKMQQVEGWQKKFFYDGVHFTPEGSGFLYKELALAFNQTSISINNMPLEGVTTFLGSSNSP
ncbi:GDSL esterase/lipase [Capsicum baccatum]|uniref:GDSL esterase/lipase n=1 Tax=Capsicum baccatum TaxID=33114 RepID=A0A2G2V6G0_CAPBA|nr:GDSL esterase/lipase [Capsicum baccatum]